MKLPIAQTESAALPPLYAGWVRSLLGGPIPAETNATCDDCAMCDATASPKGSVTWYNPATKCCTYLPEIPNFLVGRILFDTDPAMVANLAPLEARLNGSAVNPLSIAIPAAYSALYRSFPNRFGHSTEMRCPHYIEEGGKCGIWRHRNSICATWFCKLVRGAVGGKFWIAIMQLLRSIERELSIWCINQLFADARPTMELFATRFNGAPLSLATEDGPRDVPRDSPRYKAIWGEWFGRERQYFQRCGELVGALDWTKVASLCGQDTRLFATAVSAAYRDLLDESLPPALTCGNIEIVSFGKAEVRVSGYQPIDPLDMPRELFDVLAQFDGRSTPAALQTISDEHGLELSEELVRRLVDFDILRPAKAND